MKLYEIDLDYLNYLHTSDSRVLTHNVGHHKRKFIAVKKLINGFEYFVPMSSPDQADYFYKENKQIIRKTKVPTILRLIDYKASGEEELLGKLLFNNMIPVPKGCYKIYDAKNEKDINYKNLVNKQLRVLRAKQKEIEKRASTVYNLKKHNVDYAYIKFATVDFLLLEAKCIAWAKISIEEMIEI